VVLCGNPALFDPLCEALIQVPAPVYLLAERFAFRSFARWRWRGVPLLDCSDAAATDNPAAFAPDDAGPCRLNGAGCAAAPPGTCGIDLSAPVAEWLSRQSVRLRGPLRNAMRRIGEHLDRVQPGWLLVDEDATPFKRAAVALARERGIRTAVVQHGAPYVAFGFAPLAADYLFAWGESSRRQFQRWGVGDESIVVTGCPKHDAWLARPCPRRPVGDGCREVHLLLLATLHHAPERPDLAGFHLTARTHADMVRWALEAIARRPGWRLTVKLHPRCADARFFRALIDSSAGVKNRVRLLKKGDVLALARQADAVLSCASSAGIEAMIAGRPVIQLMPRGSIDLVDPEQWGFAGTARSGKELDRLLSQIGGLRAAGDAELDRNFANRRTSAAEQIVRFLSQGARSPAGREARVGHRTLHRQHA
jgi:hypothetical protein